MNIFNLIYDTRPYQSQVDKQKANLVYGMLTVMIVLYFLYALLIPEWTTDNLTMVEYASQNLAGALFLLIYFGAGIISYALLRLGNLRFASWGPIIMWSVPALLTTIFTEGDAFSDPTVTAALLALVLITGLLVDELGSILIGGVAIFALFAFSDGPILTISATVSLQVLGSTLLMIFFKRLNVTNRNEGEMTIAQELLKLAEINSVITRRASQRVNIQDILELAVKTIINKYDQIYHAQIFLLTENGVQAKLFASTGEAGKKMLANEHSLAVGSLSVIGQTTLKGQPTIEYAGVESVHRYNELLPDTKVEAAFPLRVGNEIIGALDLQSADRSSFNENNIAQFQSLADSLSLVIDNVRQYEVSQKQVQENQQLVEKARSALDEVNRLNKRLIGRAWNEYLRTQSTIGGLNVDFHENSLEEDGLWTATLAQAAQDNEIIREGHIIAIPLRVRGQVIGAMEFELGQDDELTPEDLELVAEIGERFGLAAENSRLVDESQRSARREALINQISARLQANNTIEATLTEAARSLSETLQAGRVSIRLGTPQAPNTTTGTRPPSQNGQHTDGNHTHSNHATSTNANGAYANGTKDGA